MRKDVVDFLILLLLLLLLLILLVLVLVLVQPRFLLQIHFMIIQSILVQQKLLQLLSV